LVAHETAAALLCALLQTAAHVTAARLLLLLRQQLAVR
jgi:hypothetical protein